MFRSIGSFALRNLSPLRSRGEFFEGGALPVAVLLPVESIVKRRELQMGLGPCRLLLDCFEEVANRIVQLALGAFQARQLVTRHSGGGSKLDRPLEMPPRALEVALSL